MADTMRPDMMRKPPMKGGYMNAASDPLRKNMSMFNPMDAALMKQEGQFSPDMPLGEMMTKLGFDLNAPGLPQLQEFGKKQVENADMVGKMKNIAADSQNLNTSPGRGEMPPAPTPGLEGLLSQRR